MSDKIFETMNKTEQEVDSSKPVVTLYMTEIKRYPNGTEYIKSWLVKKKNFQPKKKVTKKKVLEEKQDVICQEEVY